MPVEILGGGEVVMADDEGDAGLAELLELAFLQGLGGLELEVDDDGSRRWRPW